VADYHDTVSNQTMETMERVSQSRLGQFFSKGYNKFCAGRNCKHVNTDYIASRAEQLGEQKFYEQSGYPSTITDKGAFFRHPTTQQRLRDTVELNIRTATGNPSFALPAGWVYSSAAFQTVFQEVLQDKLRREVETGVQKATKNPDFTLPAGWTYAPIAFENLYHGIMQQQLQDAVEQEIGSKTGDNAFMLPAGWHYDSFSFKPYLQDLLRKQAEKMWKDNVQTQFKTDIQPGLDEAAFQKYLKIELPPVEKLAMSEADFIKKYVEPINKKIALDALEKIRTEAPSYANGQKLEEQGKDYIRVLYIPVIALSISLIIVVLTIGRNLVNAVCWGCEKWQPQPRFLYGRQKLVRPVSWGIFLLVVLCLPYWSRNPYLNSDAYQKYYHLAQRTAPETTRILDWVARVQPVIYRIGNALQR
jgi:hypothetical protein